MRIFICAGHEGKFYKLVWLNESRKGIFVGKYGAPEGIHFSYHVDGSRHWTSNDNKILIPLSDFTPIRKIDFVQQIQDEGHVISTDALLRSGEEYQRDDSKSSVAIFLNSGILGDNLRIKSYLLHRDREPDLVNSIPLENHSEISAILACNIFALDHYANHKVALVVLGRK